MPGARLGLRNVEINDIKFLFPERGQFSGGDENIHNFIIEL